MVIFLRDLCYYLATKLYNDALNCILYSVLFTELTKNLIICYRVIDEAAYPKVYQAQLTVIGFTADHSGIYTVTISNRVGMITEQFERRLEG